MTQDTAVPQAYPPPAEFAAQANATAALYQEADADRLDFWRRQGERLSWATPFTEVLDWSNAPFAKWFGDGKLNVAYNCVDRHRACWEHHHGWASRTGASPDASQ